MTIPELLNIMIGKSLTEQELLNKIKQDPQHFSELFNLYYKPIFGYILRRTINCDESADIAAETFLKAYKHINKFSYRGISVKVWLYRIATNEINLYFRYKKKNESIFTRIDFENKELLRGLLNDDRKEIEAELHKHEQFLLMASILKMLHQKYQDVISLKYFEGKGNKEISEILNIKEGTIKSLISRGIKKLRDEMQPNVKI